MTPKPSAILAACLAGAAFAPISAQAIPDFMSNNMGWAANGAEFKAPLDGGTGPVFNDPAHPSCGNRILPACGNKIVPRIADTKNPILQPWAAKQMLDINNKLLAGTTQAFAAMSRCWPGGVPGMMLFTAEPTYYLQLPKEVTILHIRGNNIRHIYMDTQHTPNAKPSWYGDSVGHYDGDSFVIDTIAIGDKSYVDNYRTPHTDKMHTVETYKRVDGATLQGGGSRDIPKTEVLLGIVKVDDPGTFTMPWSASQTFLKHNEAIADAENICAENNDANYFGEDEVPVPQTKRPDF